MRTLPMHVESRYADILRTMIETPGPKISLYLHASPPVDAEKTQQTVRWRDIREGLSGRGAATADLDCFDQPVAQLAAGDRSLAAFAGGGRVWLAAELGRFDEADRAVLGDWPYVVPLLRWERRQVPTVTAIVSHGEADIAVYGPDGQSAGRHVPGPDDEIERNAPGGWSQPRYRRRAEDSWAHNAAAFVAEIMRLVESTDARLLVLGGDIREVHLVLQRLPAAARAMAALDVHVQPRKDAGVGFEPRSLQASILAAARRERRHVVADFDGSGGRGLAVEGFAPVSEALARGDVRRLIVVHDREAEDVDAARAMSTSALTADALKTDAEIVVLEPNEIALVDGVGAVLRF